MKFTNKCKWMQGVRTTLAALLFTIVASNEASAALGVGDKAPALSVKQWVQGDPIDLKKDMGKHYYLIEFWATWCPPCKMSIPRLNDLQKKHAKDLKIISVTSEDDRGNTIRAVKRFIKERGDGMIYHVAIDKGVATSDAYLAAAGVMGIPHAFLVGKDGRIVWQGSPLEPDMGDVVEQVIAGKFDVNAAKAKAEIDRRLESLNYAAQMGRWTQVWDGLVGILQLDPTNEIAIGTITALYADGIRDEKTFRAWAGGFIAENRSNARAMERLANMIFLNTDPATRTPDLALTSAHAAYKASKGSDAASVAVLARVVHESGDIDRAIALQSEAVSRTDPSSKADYQAVLDYYVSCKALRADIAKLLN